MVTIRAAKSVKDTIGPIPFYFAGAWYSEAERLAAEKLIRDLGLIDQIHFEGVVSGPEMDALLLASDIMVFPSYNEGHPRVILEGMAAGLPVIATNVGAIPETIIDNKTGFIVPTDDHEALAGKICLLVKDENMRISMGNAARERLLAEFTAERSNRLLADVFYKVINEPQKDQSVN